MADKKTRKETAEKKPTEKQVKGSKKESKTQEPVLKINIRLADIYKKDIVPNLMKKFSYKSIMQVPKLDKIVVNMGVGDAVQDPKILEEAVKELETITGQKASVRKSKKAISNFKLREGMNIGAMVTLRREKMYEFMDRLINLAIPRVRDFRGLNPDGFDGRGNYSMGLSEQVVFPEINAAKVEFQQGMNINFVTTAKTDDEARKMLQLLGMPFKKD